MSVAHSQLLVIVIFPLKSLIHIMLLTGADAITAARERLHRDDSDPPDFVGLDLKSVSDADLKNYGCYSSLRNSVTS